MATADVLKEFLVSLGFKVDNSSLNNMLRAMGLAERSTASFGNSTVTSFAKATTAVIGFVVTANAGIVKYLYELGQADLRTEMFARKLWMSKDAAKAYQSSIDALGVSINDLYLSPELMNKYLDLNGQARNMAVPSGEYDKQMKSIRDITFQWQRMKLEGTYALQWIGYYLTKYLAGPMGNVKDWLTKINDTIQQKMPEWTKKVAEVVSWFVRLGVAAWSIKGALLAVLAVFTGFKMISMLSNPFGLFIIGLTTLLLLLDDFNTYSRGGKSAFPELWKWFNDLGKKLNSKELGLGTFKKDIGDIATSVGELFTNLDKLAKTLGAKGGLKEILEQGIIGTLTVLNDLLIAINAGLKELNGLITGKITIPDIASGKADKIYGNQEPEDNATFPMDEAIKSFFKDMFGFFGKHSFSLFGSGISPMSFNGGRGNAGNLNYLYPQGNQSSMTQVSLAPKYYIYGATQPEAVAQTVHKTTASLMRFTQGGIR